MSRRFRVLRRHLPGDRRDLCSQFLRLQHLRVRAPREDPADNLVLARDGQRQDERAVGLLLQRLRRVPPAPLEVGALVGGEADTDRLRLAAGADLHLERVTEEVRNSEVDRGLEDAVRKLQLLDAPGEEGPELAAEVAVADQVPLAGDRKIRADSN